jgi:hypothetical protein
MPGYPDRCQHVKVNGVQCGSPALRRNRFCFFHKRFQDERIRLATDRARRSPAIFTLPVLEDANSVQIALMQVMRLLLSRQIEHKTASLLLYALQTASSNLPRTMFAPNVHEIILDPRDAAITPLTYRAWEDHEFDDDEDEYEEEEEDNTDHAVETKPVARARETSSLREIEVAPPLQPQPETQPQQTLVQEENNAQEQKQEQISEPALPSPVVSSKLVWAKSAASLVPPALRAPRVPRKPGRKKLEKRLERKPPARTCLDQIRQKIADQFFT